MGTMVAMLLLTGCTDDLSHCRDVPIDAAVYATIEACEADMSGQLQDAAGVYPQIFADCRLVDPEQVVMVYAD